MIQLSHLEKIYTAGPSRVVALNDVSLEIPDGDFVAIMGPSGSGKSTLMNVIGLLDVPDSGSYRLGGRDVSRLSPDALAKIRADELGFVFQQFHLLPRTSALENAALPLLYGSVEPAVNTARDRLRDVGLGDRAHHRPNELSGGQQQRVAIARALVNNPQVVLADEPTGNLDSTTETEIMGLLTDLNRRGLTIVLVTHEASVAAHARRVVRMRDGRVLSDEVRPGAPPLPAAAPRPPLPHDVPPTFRVRAQKFLVHGRQAFRAMVGNKVRTVLSVLGILIGVASVIAMLALGSGAQKSIESQLASMGSNLLVVRSSPVQSGGVRAQGGGRVRLAESDATDFRENVPSVRRVAPLVSGRVQLVYGNKNWNTELTGTVPDYALMQAAVPQAGRFFTEEEGRTRARVAVIGMTVYRELFGAENPLQAVIRINRIPFVVIGVLPERGSGGFRDQDDVVLVPLSTALRRVLGEDKLDAINVEVASADKMDSAQEMILERLNRRYRVTSSGDELFRVRNMADIQEAIASTNRTMTLLLAVIAGISLLVGGIGIMNIMLVSVKERTREIGLRKALGARRSDILTQFLIEAVVVSAAGGVGGIALGALSAVSLARVAGWSAIVSPGAVALAFFFSAAIGVIFGFWPARQAAKLDPILALRYE